MLKKMRACLSLLRHSKTKAATRIVYHLPETKNFKKFYNQDQLFCDADWNNWSGVIDGFEKRFTKWYFAHMTGGHASYIDLCALCALVEVFSYYQSDKDWHAARNYREFLRKLDQIFRTKLHTPITVTRYKGGNWEIDQLDDFADVFYTGVRCSLHHHGDLASFTAMSGTGKLAIQVPDAGQSLCGTYRFPVVVFDPQELKVRLSKWFVGYCDKLRKKPTSEEAKRFRQKFLNDFGITIP
jgi:hypothetical protein